VKGACEDLREVFDSVVVRKKSKAHGVAAAFTNTFPIVVNIVK